MASAEDVRAALAEAADSADAKFLQRFFKTGPGEYGEGDVFIGIRVPATRAVVKRFSGLPPVGLGYDEIDELTWGWRSQPVLRQELPQPHREPLGMLDARQVRRVGEPEPLGTGDAVDEQVVSGS